MFKNKNFATRTSLLKARDPSILTGNCPLEAAANFLHEPKNPNKGDNCLDVYLRIKGGVEGYEKLYTISDSKTLISIVPEGCELSKNTKQGDVVKKKYSFSKIFGPCTKQTDIFDELVKPKLLKFMNGHNSTIMTYGVSGSGKTYTIVGTSEAPGILPRSLEYLFRTLPKLPEIPSIKPLQTGGVAELTNEEIAKEIEIKQQILNFEFPGVDKAKHIEMYQAMQECLREFPGACLDDAVDISITIWVSFTEIYNEHVYDLLDVDHKKSRTKLKLGAANGCTFIKNLSYVHVSSGLEAFQMLQYGLHHLNYAKTKINDHSSRSHSIFSIILTEAHSKEGECSVSKFNFCDLAGAERSKKTMNKGQRLKESNNINTSLLVLGRCIAGVRNNQNGANQLIPFRDSKLTQIFQKALSGHEEISMIVNINPCAHLFDETQHVLNFSAIAKKIIIVTPRKTASTINLKPSTHNLQATAAMKEQDRKIEELKNEISEYYVKLEEEEMDYQMQENEMRQELMSIHLNKFESRKEELESNYNELQKTLKREYKNKLKAKKQNYSSMSAESSDFTSSDDSDEENTNWLNRSSRKRKHEVETITIYSSDEEDYISLWEMKIANQKHLIDEHHQTISALKDEIETIKLKNQQLEEKLRERISIIQESRASNSGEF